MKKAFTIIALVLLAALTVHSAPFKPAGNYDLTGWTTMKLSETQVVASGGAPVVRSDDGKLRLSANQIVLNLVGKAKGSQTISTAEAVGKVIIHAVSEQGQQIDAVCEKAVIYPSAQRAELSGNVKVNQRDQKRFSGSMELTSDKVTLNLRDGRVTATSRTSRGRLRTNSAPAKGH
jgi:lipopolysaccharide export system protein LptA